MDYKARGKHFYTNPDSYRAYSIVGEIKMEKPYKEIKIEEVLAENKKLRIENAELLRRLETLQSKIVKARKELE